MVPRGNLGQGGALSVLRPILVSLCAELLKVGFGKSSDDLEYGWLTSP